MKNQIKLLLIPLFVLSSSLDALVRVGEGSIDFILDLSTYYDSNINSRSDGLDDFILTASPGLTYSRDSKNFGMEATAGISFIKYVDNDQYDDANFFFDLSLTPNARMETSRFVVSGDLILQNETRSEESVGEIVTVLTYGASGQIVYNPNSRYSIIGSASYTHEDPDSPQYSQQDRYGAGLSVEVPMNENIDTQAGVSYEYTQSDDTLVDNEVYTYFVGLSGNLLPKLAGNISGGIQQRTLDSGGKDNGPYLAAGLDWMASERTQMTLDAFNGFGTTIDDQTSKTFTVTLTGRHQLSRAWSINADIGYIEEQYSGLNLTVDRTDKQVFIGAGTSYQLVEWGSIGLDFRYSDKTSTDATFEYDRLRVGIIFSGQW
jgi:hypothetical protein